MPPDGLANPSAIVFERPLINALRRLGVLRSGSKCYKPNLAHAPLGSTRVFDLIKDLFALVRDSVSHPIAFSLSHFVDINARTELGWKLVYRALVERLNLQAVTALIDEGFESRRRWRKGQAGVGCLRVSRSGNGNSRQGRSKTGFHGVTR